MSGEPVATGDDWRVQHNAGLIVDAARGVLADDYDPSGASLTAQLVDGPANGALTFHADGSFSYLQNVGFTGDDTFTYRASNGTSLSNVATVTIHVNAPPVAQNDTLDVARSGSTSGVVQGSDADGDPLRAKLVQGPAHGTLVFNNDGSFTYTPLDSGPDSFRYRVYDGLENSNVATVYLNVNTPPTVGDASFALDKNGSLTVAFTQSDADGDALSDVLVTQPAHGQLSLNDDGSFTYTPDEGYVGTDSFSFSADDGKDSSAAATVQLLVRSLGPGIDLPERLVASAGEDLQLSGMMSVDAEDVGQLRVSLSVEAGSFSFAQHAGLTLVQGTWAQSRQVSFTGSIEAINAALDALIYSSDGTETDTLTLAVTDLALSPDGLEHTATCVTAIRVMSLDLGDDRDASLGVPITIWGTVAGTFNDSQLQFTWNVTDPDGNAIDFQDNHNGSITFTPYNAGNYVVSLGVHDNTYGSDASRQINVNAAANFSIVLNATQSVDQGDEITVTATFNGWYDETAFEYTWIVVNASGNQISFQYNGDDSITFTADELGVYTVSLSVHDGTYDSDATSSIEVTSNEVEDGGDPDSGNLGADDFELDLDQDSDASDNLLNYAHDNGSYWLVSINGQSFQNGNTYGTGNGQVTVYDDGSFTYTPSGGWSGDDSFTFTVQDDWGTQAQATVTLHVHEIVDDNGQTDPPEGFTADTDESGIVLTWTSGAMEFQLDRSTDGANWTTVVSYEDLLGFEGTFIDRQGLEAGTHYYYRARLRDTGRTTPESDWVYTEATASATSGDSGDLGADDFELDLDQDSDASDNLLNHAHDNGGYWLVSINGQSLQNGNTYGTGNGQVTVYNDGSFTYTPNGGWSGDDSFTFTVQDDWGAQAQATVTLHVHETIAPSIEFSGDGCVVVNSTAYVYANLHGDWGGSPQFTWSVVDDNGVDVEFSDHNDNISFSPSNVMTYHVQVHVATGDGLYSADAQWDVISTEDSTSYSVSLDGDQNVGVGQMVTVTSYIDGDWVDPQYTWNVVDGDGNPAEFTDHGTWIEFAPGHVGTYQVSVHVESADGSHTADSDTVSIVSSESLTASITGPVNVIQGNWVTFAANVGGAPGDADLVYTWTVLDPNGDAVEIEDGREWVGFRADLAGAYSISLHVDDMTYGGAADSETVYSTSRLEQLTPALTAPSSVTQGDWIVVTSNLPGASELAELQYTWQVKDANNEDVAFVDYGNSIRFVADILGNYAVSLHVEDSVYGVSGDSDLISVATVAESLAASITGSTSMTQGNTLVLQASIQGASDTAQLSYYWAVTAPDGSFVTIVTWSNSMQFLAEQNGTYGVSLTVIDNKYDHASAQASAEVQAAAETLSADITTSNVLVQGNWVTARATVSGASATAILQYAWTATKSDGTAIEFENLGGSIRFLLTDIGDYTLSVEVIDAVYGATAEADVVLSSAPEQLDVTVTGGAATVQGDWVTLTANVAGTPDTGALHYAWTVLDPSGNVVPIIGSGYSVRFLAAVAGSYAISATANDTVYGGSDSASATVISAVNTGLLIQVPPAVQPFASGSIVFSSADGTAISISAPGVSNVQVILSVASGSLTLGPTVDPSLQIASAYGGKTVMVSGSLDLVNQALNGLTYTPADSTASYDGLSVTVIYTDASNDSQIETSQAYLGNAEAFGPGGVPNANEKEPGNVINASPFYVHVKYGDNLGNLISFFNAGSHTLKVKTVELGPHTPEGKRAGSGWEFDYGYSTFKVSLNGDFNYYMYEGDGDYYDFTVVDERGVEYIARVIFTENQAVASLDKVQADGPDGEPQKTKDDNGAVKLAVWTPAAPDATNVIYITSGNKIPISVTIALSVADPNAEVMVRGSSSAADATLVMWNFSWSGDLTQGADAFHYEGHLLSDKVIDGVNAFDDMTITWQVSLDGGITWKNMAHATAFKLFVIRGDAGNGLANDIPYQTILSLVTHATAPANELTDPQDLIDRVFYAFDVLNVHAIDGAQLSFYGDWLINNDVNDVSDLLALKDGTNGEWVQLLYLAFIYAGVPMEMLSGALVKPIDTDYGILIKNFDFDGQAEVHFVVYPGETVGSFDPVRLFDGNHFNWGVLNPDTGDADGMPAQGTENPMPLFPDYGLLKLTIGSVVKYYDPCFGKIYTSLLDFQQQMVAGLWKTHVAGGMTYIDILQVAGDFPILSESTYDIIPQPAS